ncbi:MAG: DUF3572 domain-containing protein [Sphingobium sp.]
MRPEDRNGNGGDPETVALRALTWVLGDDMRATRLLALTGLDPAQLRLRAGDREILSATMEFLCAHEPDLLACATALDLPPAALAASGRSLAA